MDRSKECKCPCHTGGAVHIMACSCYAGNPVLDKETSSEVAFKMPPLGALVPPELSWQEGQTAGYIASVNLIIELEATFRVRNVSNDAELAALQKIDEHLKWLGVRPASDIKMRKDKNGKVEVLDEDGNVIGRQG